MAPLPAEKRYTYADLLDWDTSIRYELYDGQPVALASPSDLHQELRGALFVQLPQRPVDKVSDVPASRGGRILDCGPYGPGGFRPRVGGGRLPLPGGVQAGQHPPGCGLGGLPD